MEKFLNIATIALTDGRFHTFNQYVQYLDELDCSEDLKIILIKRIKRYAKNFI